MNLAFLEGKQAAAQGKSLSDNPHLTGELTKLGTPKMTEDGQTWVEGFQSVGRRATPQEVKDAAAMDISHRRRKPNRCYK